MIDGAFDPTTALAITGVIAGLGGAVYAGIKVGPERTNIVVTYQAQVLDDLQEENRRLIAEKAGWMAERADMIERQEAMEERIEFEERKRKELASALAQVQRERADDARRAQKLEDRIAELEGNNRTGASE